MKQQKHLYKALFFIINFILAYLAYNVLISNELTNTYDGLWHGANHQAAGWEISIGRWFWPTANSIFHNNIEPEPFTSSLSLAMIVFGSCLIIQMFDLWEHWYSFLITLGITINTTVCSFLSYRYMSPIFSFSFLTSIIVVWSIIQFNKKEALPSKLAGIIISTFFFAISLGLYQANIGCTCLLILVWLIYLLGHEKNWKNIAIFAIQGILIFICGCLLYNFLWKYELAKYGIQPSDYNGANNVSITYIIQSLPKRINLSYYTWDQFFSCKTSVIFNALADNRFVFLLYSLFFIVIILVIMEITSNAVNIKDGIIRAVLALLFFTLFPIASTIFYLLSPDSSFIGIQMTMPMIITVPILICLLPNQIFKTKINTALYDGGKKAYLLFTMAAIYGSFLQVSVDQHSMLQSKRSALALMDGIIADIENDDLNKYFVFLGKPANNPLYRKNDLWEKANSYTKYGDFWLENECNTMSYYGLLRDAGYNLPFNGDHSFWHYLEQQEDIKNMPAYPDKGYYQIIDNNIVIKVSY